MVLHGMFKKCLFNNIYWNKIRSLILTYKLTRFKQLLAPDLYNIVFLTQNHAKSAVKVNLLVEFTEDRTLNNNTIILTHISLKMM